MLGPLVWSFLSCRSAAQEPVISACWIQKARARSQAQADTFPAVLPPNGFCILVLDDRS
uniref:Uncharacterized protein n=1 Tax=Anguilla anguilla TaxID=7936 RepID=A0A0E9PFH2_ANGAN